MNSANPTPVDAFSSNNPFRRAATSRTGSPVKSPAMESLAAALPQQTSLQPQQKTPVKSPRSGGSSNNPFADPLSPFSSPPAIKADSARPSDEISVCRPSFVHQTTSLTITQKGMASLSVRPTDGSGQDFTRVRPSSSPDKNGTNFRAKELGTSPEKRSKPSGRSRSRPSKGRSKAPALDFVDGLDTSWQLGIGASMYWHLLTQRGSLTVTGMHHGGPFDPCNLKPKKGKLNPIEAFAPNSRNMTMTGGAVNSKTAKDEQFDVLHMNNDEGYGDFNSATARTKKAEMAAMDATARVEQIHSDETAGLGTSTFLEGAPAPRREIERRASEAGQENITISGGGLGGMTRRPSVLKVLGRTRGYSQGRVTGSGEQEGRDRRYPPPSMPQSAGGIIRASAGQEKQNPFFANNTTDATIDRNSPADRSMGRPMGAPLTRRVTESGARRPAPPQPERQQSGGGPGFLGRWKSIRRNNNPPGPPQQATVPPGMI